MKTPYNDLMFTELDAKLQTEGPFKASATNQSEVSTKSNSVKGRLRN